MDRDIRLTNRTITLCPYQKSDIESLYEAARESITEVFPWIPFCHPNYSIEESKAFIEGRSEKMKKGTGYDFAITDTNTGKYLGGCGINRIQNDWKVRDIGYWVRTSQTKKGIATATTLLLARFAFIELELNRVQLIIAVGNIPSLRVAEKVDAVKEGILRNGLTINGKPTDAVMFSLIPTDLL